MPSNGPAANLTLPTFNPTDFAKLGKEQADAFLEMQQELGKLIEQANKDWLARAELERQLATELAAQLSAVKSMPDAAKVYQEWMSRRMETVANDSQKFFADCQKFALSMNRFLARGAVNPTH